VALFKSDGNKADTIYRSKAVGEPPLMLPISVWCAVMDAVASVKPGVVPKLNAPATPEAILKAVRGM
jgi:xanthine dehydrogenase large subunit